MPDQIQSKSVFECVDIVVVHYKCARATVAMLSALFKAYPEICITLVDNSGGLCLVDKLVLPYLVQYKSNIQVLTNTATEHGSRGPLSHGAGLDLAFKNSKKPYLLSLESDLFILEPGAIEYAVSLLEQGYDWAGIGQKPADGGFGSFSPCFAIFKVALIIEHKLSFRVCDLNQAMVDPAHPLLQHHRQTAARVRKGLPLLYPQGKPPDTYRRPRHDIERTELGHLAYFDTGEWVHHELTRLGYRGYLFVSPPGVCHTWGSRDDAIFLLNFQTNLPSVNINDFLPPELQIGTHVGTLPGACLALTDVSSGGPAKHWRVPANKFGVALNAIGSTLEISGNLPANEKIYISNSPTNFDSPPPVELGATISPGVFYRLKCAAKLDGHINVDLWVIEYGLGKRIQHHVAKLSSRVNSLEFLTNNTSDQFCVLFRVTGAGSIQIEELALSSIDFQKPGKFVGSPSRFKPKKNACIVISADALRADFDALASHYHAQDAVTALSQFQSAALSPGRAYAPAPWTLPSHMSMFTGLHPQQHGYGVDFTVGRCYPLPTHLTFLPDFLCKQGIPSYGFHNGGVMEPNRGLGHGWTKYVGAHPGDVDGPVHNFIKALPDLGDTFFAFIHTYAVHNYYGESNTDLALDLVSPKQRLYINQLMQRWGNLRWLMAENLKNGQLADGLTLDVVRRLYVGAVLRFDRLLQQLVDALKTTGSFDQCTIILTSDHGEALGEVHSGTQHWSHMTLNVHEETVRVPFFLKPAKGRDFSLGDTLSLVDLPNIVTSCFDLPAMFPVRPTDAIFATGATHQFGAEWERTMPPEQRVFRSMLLDGNKKYHLLGNNFYLEKVCDVQADPAENVYVFDDVDQQSILERIQPFVKPIPFETDPIDSEDEDVLDRMRGLGYVE